MLFRKRAVHASAPDSGRESPPEPQVNRTSTIDGNTSENTVNPRQDGEHTTRTTADSLLQVPPPVRPATTPEPQPAWIRSVRYHPLSHDYFKSRRIKKGSVEHPWKSQVDPREKWNTIIPMIGLFAGLIVAGILIWDGWRTVGNWKYCLVLDEQFQGMDDGVTGQDGSGRRGLDEKIWGFDVECGGFGNGQFEMTTASRRNAYIENSTLVIKPTLQDAALMNTNTTIDLGLHGCTGSHWNDCITTTNTTNGTLVQPVLSGRIHTKHSTAIRYGRVEVVAKLPHGDWLWPAIWMLPVNSTYGSWPRSGEIDILESRGNNRSYELGGVNVASSALHFGPDAKHDGWRRFNEKRKALHGDYSQKFHTFGVEWTPRYIFTYIDTRLLQVLYTPFSAPLYPRGAFPLSDGNGTRLVNPWAATHSSASPFDQDFYLILNVAVGGTNGWFKNGKGGKPWLDESPRDTAVRDFWNARGQWGASWEKGGWMEVKRVRMWQQSGWNGCAA